MTTYYGLNAVGIHARWLDALLFGAVISPTDPIAVLGVLKSAGAPHELEVKMAGESLFNDGIGVVLFTVLVTVASGGKTDVTGVLALFAREALGGIAFGFVAGYIGFRMLRTIDDYSVEVLITLALVVAGAASLTLKRRRRSTASAIRGDHPSACVPRSGCRGPRPSSGWRSSPRYRSSREDRAPARPWRGRARA